MSKLFLKFVAQSAYEIFVTMKISQITVVRFARAKVLYIGFLVTCISEVPTKYLYIFVTFQMTYLGIRTHRYVKVMEALMQLNLEYVL